MTIFLEHIAVATLFGAVMGHLCARIGNNLTCRLIAKYEKDHPGKCGTCSFIRYSNSLWYSHDCKEER